MTLQDKLRRLGEALQEAVEHTYHYWRPKMDPPFLVWQEDGENSVSADNQKGHQAITGVADYYTKQEYDPAIDAIQTTFNRLGVSWELASVAFEDETGLIHYSWDWEVL